MTTAISATEWIDSKRARGQDLTGKFHERLKQLYENAPFDERSPRRRSLHMQPWLMPTDYVSPLNFRDHGDLLEAEWPGCSVMWDAHPALKLWPRYFLAIVENYVGNAPKERNEDSALNTLGHRRHRKTRWKMLDEARKHGTHQLVAYELQPPTWKPAMVAVEIITRGVDDEGVEYVSSHSHFVPQRAIYTASETRWTLVR